MRFLVLASVAALGCSSPAPEDADPWHYTRDSAVQGEEAATVADSATVDTATAADTWTPPDTYAPPPDTYTADSHTAPPDTYTPPPDTGPPVCYPAAAVSVCTTAVPLTYPCGKRPDGCGGTVACDACPVTRRCVTTPTSLGHCSCKAVSGPLCLDRNGVYVGKWTCGVNDVPMHPDAALFPQPDGSVSVWCVPSTPY